MDPNVLDALKQITGDLADSSLRLKHHNRYLQGRENTSQTRQMVGAMASRLVREVMSFCLGGQLHGSDRVMNEKGLQIAMRRFVAVAWLLHSEMLIGPDGNPMSLDQLGKLQQLDCTRCALSLMAQKFGNQFDFHGRVQKCKGGKVNYAVAAKRGWKKRLARQVAASSGYHAPPS